MKHNIAKSALWVTISEVFFNLSGFIIHAVLGRFLGPDDYGRYGLIVTLTTMVIILIGNGIPTAMAKYISEYFETDADMVLAIKRRSIQLQAIIIGIVTVLFYFSIPLIAGALGDPTLIPLFKISTLIIPAFAAASFYFSYYTGLHRFNMQATLKTTRSIFRIAFVVGLALIFGVKGSITGYIIAPFSVFLIAFLIDKFKIDPELKERSTGKAVDFEWKKLTNYAWQVVAFFLAYELLISIDLYLVKGILHDDYLTGIYNGVLTVGRIPYYIFYAMTIFLLPMVSRAIGNNNHQEARDIISKSIRIMIILLVPMIIIMSAYSMEILQLFYGHKYVVGAYPMSIFVYGVGFLTIFYVLSFAMNGAGQTKIPMWISIFGVTINTILNYILVSRYSITGSAVATSITSFLITVLMLYYLNRLFKVYISVLTMLRVLLAGSLVYFVSNFMLGGKYIFILWSIILFVLYILTLFAIKEIKKDDLQFLMQVVKRKKVAEVQEELSGNEPSA